MTSPNKTMSLKVMIRMWGGWGELFQEETVVMAVICAICTFCPNSAPTQGVKQFMTVIYTIRSAPGPCHPYWN